MRQTTGIISDILKYKGSQVWSTAPHATVYEAIQLMAEKNVGALVVLQDGRLTGIISERDYTRKVILKGKASKETTVSEVLSGSVVCITPAQTVEDGLRLMTDHHIRHLPVVDNDQLLGIVSIGDLVNWIISAQSHTIQQLQSYITGGYPT